jgi:hypothetical protein
LLQADWAALNAGENGLSPDPPLNWMPPPGLGSGKFGTPCERMHCEKATGRPLATVDVPGLLAEPHAEMTTAQLRAAIAIAAQRPWLPEGSVFVAFRISHAPMLA